MVLDIPAQFMAVPYDGEKYPGVGAIGDLCGGANCQLFAYAVLAHFGRDVPPLRSSQLWEDTAHTRRVTTLEPLDLLLFGMTADPYGAHVGVYLGEGTVLHLPKRIGVPAIWTLDDFAAAPGYTCFIGAKRVNPPFTANANW